MNEKIKKATRHTNQNEGLIFEKSSPGKRAFELPPLDVPKVDVVDPLQAHMDMWSKWTDTDIHNMTAYLAGLK